MNRLKTILKTALNEKSEGIRIEPGASPVLFSASEPDAPARGEPPLGPNEIEEFQTFLFPNDWRTIRSGQNKQGVLNIPNVGKIKLIATPQNEIFFYLPPHGEELFVKKWDLLNRPLDERFSPEANQIGNSPLTFTAIPVPNFDPTNSGADIATQPAREAVEQKSDNLPASEPPTGADPIFSGSMFASAPSAGVATPGQDDVADFLTPPPEPLPVPGNDLVTPPTGNDTASPSFGSSMQLQELAQKLESGESPHVSFRANEGFSQALASTPPADAEASQPTEPRMMPAIATPLPVDYNQQIHFGAEPPGSKSVSNGANLIDALFYKMIELGASDMHLTCGEPIVYRIDGEITKQESALISDGQMREYLLPIMPEINKKEFFEINDTDFAYELKDFGRFRANIFRDRAGVGAVFRHIPSKILTADQLGLPNSIRNLCQLTKGLVLVTGPTGSGKSTTLAAMIDLINRNRPDHILTIEDPIEFVHPQQMSLVNQREVHKHTGSFSRALKAALREDPDIILIGEMRDLETIAIAIETAETGHLVFGTLHTTTAISTVDRIIDQFPADQQEQIRTMLSSSLKGVVAQTLLKKIGGGRVAAHEILIPNDAVAAMIREGKTHMIENHMQTQKQDGNQLLNESLISHVRSGDVDITEAYRKSVQKKSFVQIAKRFGLPWPEETNESTKTV